MKIVIALLLLPIGVLAQNVVEVQTPATTFVDKNIVYDNLSFEKKMMREDKNNPGTQVEYWGRGATGIASKELSATFRTKFFVPPGHEKNRWVFEADRAGGDFAISVNGKKIGECLAPIIRFQLGNIIPGTNTVELYCAREYEGLSIVNAKTNAYREKLRRNKNPEGKFGTYKLGFYGKTRIVELSSPADLRNAWAETSVRNKSIKIKAKVSSTEDFEGVISCTIMDPKGRKELTFDSKQSFKKGENIVSAENEWKNPKLWDVGEPNLYFAEIKIRNKEGRTIDTLKPFRFGFREVWTEGRKVMLNGHPFRARMEMGWLPLNKTTLGFYKYIGRNTHYIQPHGNCWWGWWGETPEIREEVLDICDEEGIICFCPATGVTHIGELVDKTLHESYKQNLEDWIQLYRNRPSIIAWGISMNAYNPKGSIAPDLFGRREKIPSKATDGWSCKAITIDCATRFCKEVDPTRLSYGHGDGGIGDIASANCYPNITPYQEVIDYPAKWAKDGDMPWAAVEYGVYDGSFYKNERLFLTEYCTIYFGEDAYNRETQEQLENTIKFGMNCRFYGGNMLEEVVKTTDLYWDYMRMFTSGTDKYWRAYGMFGWLHFFGARYGQKEVGGWGKIKEPLSADKAPEWATPQVEINRVNMQDFLAFIGGEEAYTDQTHTYYEDEKITKNAVIVWDGAKPITVNITWVVTDENGKGIKREAKTLTALPGETMQLPFTWTPPKKGERANYQFAFNAVSGKHKMSDNFSLDVFPRKNMAIKTKDTVYFYDPAKKSAWVKTLLPSVKDFVVGTRLEKGDVLIIGREALKPNNILPYKMADVEKGARVLILEQSPMLWSSYGFRLIDMVTRVVYETPYSSALMDDLNETDLRYWRGTPTLLPEFKPVRNVAQPPKGVNRHGVASTVFEIPNVYGFEPMFQCEFDLRYSPLLRLRQGEGAVYYSSFDFTDRVGVDPSATILAKNLLSLSLEKTRKATKSVCEKFDSKCDILVNTGVVDPKTDEFLSNGGIVLNIALKDEELKKRGINFEKKKLYRVKLDGDLATGGATRNMFRWRDYLDVNCITEKGAQCEGVWYRKGKEIFLQVGSSMLEGRYDEKKEGIQKNAVMPTILALDLLKSRVLTMLGAKADQVYYDRLDTVCSTLPYTSIKDWYVYGPFITKPSVLVGFYDEFPGEEQAIRGDVNPNIVYKVSQNDKSYNYKNVDDETKKRSFDFRTKIEADSDGYVNLTKELKLLGRTAFVYMIHHWKEEKAGEKVFSFTFPSRASVYMNGELAASFIDCTCAHNGATEPSLNAYSVRLKVKDGENVMTIKLGTLPADWKVNWDQRVSVTKAIDGIKLEDIVNKATSCTLYNKKGNIGYAYSYHYW